MEEIRIFRHEFKYRIDKTKFYNIRDKLNKVLLVDRDTNGYMIKSLYFDSVNEVDYYDKMDGVCNRKKIRMRIYDDNPNLIKLEIKNKYDIHQLKESLTIDIEIAKELIQGNYGVLLDIDNDIARKIYLIMRENCYLPKCVIEYKRMAFVSNNDTRITLDYDIRRSDDVNSFFSKDINMLNITNGNEAILEVKFNRFLEPYIGNIIKNYIVDQESISKYIMARDI